MKPKKAYCSWCFNNTLHSLGKKNYLGRDEYRCRSCGNKTITCRYCSAMAKGEELKNRQLNALPEMNGDKEIQPSWIKRSTHKINQLSARNWSNELCAEHDGEIASFEKLTLKLKNIDQFKEILKRDKWDLSKAGTYLGASAAGVVSLAAIAGSNGTATPAVASALGKMGLLGAASTGTTISTLSGAALTNASLAAIGGSMAVGTAIISSVVVGLAGTYGGVIANRYIAEDKSFNILHINKIDSNNNTVFINGFLQEKDMDFSDWKANFHNENTSLYGVTWRSETLLSLGESIGFGIGKPYAKKELANIAKAGGKSAAASLSKLSALPIIGDLLSNPWHRAMLSAAKTGAVLADIIARTDGQRFNLVGHSLGCRVIYYALAALGTKHKKYINDVILLGGAVGNEDYDGWKKATAAIHGNIYNCHSDNDSVLKIMYQTTNAGLSTPIGLKPIPNYSSKINNIDCTDFVDSHMTWKKHIGEIQNIIDGLTAKREKA